MGDAAQGEPRKHEVFSQPFKVEPQLESWPTPGNYRRYPGGDQLPDTITVWRVQNTGKSSGGVVARSFGFDDSPDAEILTPGFNHGKESGAIGVGRHGNFLQWGFSAPPSKMTDAGRMFFLNCICYISKFDGKAPLIYRRSSHRVNAIRRAAMIEQIRDATWAGRTFPADLLEKYEDNPRGLTQYYRDHFELIYRDKHYLVDAQLQALGIESNRQLSTLARLIELLDQPAHAAAAKAMLARYTEQTFTTAQQWRTWLDQHEGRIYFSDVGGYKFRVIPAGYLLAGEH